MGTVLRVAGEHLFAPSIREAAIFRVLDALSAGINPATANDEEAAVLATLLHTPRALSMFLRRNPAWLATQIERARH